MNGKQLFEEWNAEYSNKNSKKNNFTAIKKICEITGTSLDDLVKMSAKECKQFILKAVQPKMQEMGYMNGTISRYVSGLQAFFASEQINKPMKFKRGRLIEMQMAMGYHEFSKKDLMQIYDCSSTRMKAILAVTVSTGFEISVVQDMDFQEYKQKIEWAITNKKPYVFFESVRKKTNKPRFVVLNPLAIEALNDWFKQRKISSRSNNKTVFGISRTEIYRTFQKAIKNSGIVLSGSRGARFHDLRAWVMTNLLSAKFNQYQTKLVMGKGIPMSDATYIKGLQTQIKEKYPQVYYEFLSIKPQSIYEQTIQQKMDALENLVKAKTVRINELETELEIYAK